MDPGSEDNITDLIIYTSFAATHPRSHRIYSQALHRRILIENSIGFTQDECSSVLDKWREVFHWFCDARIARSWEFWAAYWNFRTRAEVRLRSRCDTQFFASCQSRQTVSPFTIKGKRKYAEQCLHISIDSTSLTKLFHKRAVFMRVDRREITFPPGVKCVQTFEHL